jgi:3D (Asp-Asp-Asp) domain-containing protein
MQLARSSLAKVLVTAVAAGGFVWLYEATILDSRSTVPSDTRADKALPEAGARLGFSVTAYCKGVITAAGVAPLSGVAASDPAVLPMGSIVELELNKSKYNGIYTVLDTGPSVQGLELDLYMWSCYEALDFGRQRARVKVLRLGWHPQAKAPSLLERVFRRPDRPKPPEPLPARTLPPVTVPPSE